jgi:hypothetical protein
VYCSPENAIKGDPVTLSYIPLSGLCRMERQLRLQESYHFMCTCNLCQDTAVPGSVGFTVEQSVGGDFAADGTSSTNATDLVSTLAPLRELQIDCYQKLTLASSMPPSLERRHNVEDGTMSRIEMIEQCIATVRMAQRGIRNQSIPDSHEVSLECHRLLAVSFSLLGEDSHYEEDDEGSLAVDEEREHHLNFFRAVEPVLQLLDPSALAIQHMLMSLCLQSKLDGKPDGKNNDGVKRGSADVDCEKEIMFHATKATEIAWRALGQDHPLVTYLHQALPEPISLPSKRRRLGH